MSAWIDKAALVALVGVLAARPLIPEVFARLTSALVSTDVGGPTPATSTWLDFILLAVSAIVIGRHGFARRRAALVGAAIALLTLSVGLSTWGAGDRRVALNAAAELLAFAAAAVALVRLVAAQPGFAALLAAAAVASAGVNALKCGTQAAFEFADTLDAWHARKTQLADAGRDVNDPAAVNFERRLRSGETFGYLAHPNVTGSILAAGAAFLLGAAVALLRPPAASRALAAAVAIILAAAIIAALWTTGSTGAAIALAFAAAVALALALLRRRIAARPARAAALFLGIQAAALALLLGFGLARSTLPGTSLAFRWEYWTAAGQAYAEAPLTGIGRENFAPWHMRFKPPDATEEVRNPHNLWISLLVETGPAGLLAVVLLLSAGAATAFLGFSGAVTPSPGSRSTTGPADPEPAPAGPLRTDFRLAAASGAAALVALAFFGDVPLTASGVAVVWSLEVAAAWLILYFGVLRVLAARPEAIRIGGLAAAAALLTHNLIDFSLITPSGLAMLSLVLAAATLNRSEPIPQPSPPRRRFISGAFVAILALAHLYFVARPTQHTADLAARIDAIFARPLSPAHLTDAYDIGRTAIRDDSLESALPAEIAGRFSALLDQPGLPPERADEFAGRARALATFAMERDKRNPTSWALLARTYDQHAEILEQLGKQRDAGVLRLNAAALWDDAITRYPTNPRWRIDAAAAWLATLSQEADAPQAVAARAAAHLSRALEIDATRPAENASKLRPAELDRIRVLQGKIAQITR